MKILEKKQPLKIEVCDMHTDEKFKYYDSRTNTHKDALWIDKTPLWNKNHVLIYSGCCGSGKTTCSISLLTSQAQRVYRGVFDTILVSAPCSTLKSIGNNPFETLPKNQVWSVFDESFLDFALEVCEYNSRENKDTLIWIDDGASELKSNKRVIDKLSNMVMKHRHLRCSLHILVQDLIQVPLCIRENVSGIIFFKPVNSKRTRLFHEEYLSELTYHEFLELNDYLFKKKGDFLFIKMGNPREFHKNFNKLEFHNLSNASEKKLQDS